MTTYDERQKAWAAKQAQADADAKALMTPEGLRACFPCDPKAHGYRWPASRRVARELLNQGRAPSKASVRALAKQRERSIAGMDRATEGGAS